MSEQDEIKRIDALFSEPMEKLPCDVDINTRIPTKTPVNSNVVGEKGIPSTPKPRKAHTGDSERFSVSTKTGAFL